MSNALYWARSIKAEGIVRSATGDGRAWRTSPAMVEARLSIFRGIREGRLAGVTGTVERLLGRAPIPFARWADENAAAFR